MMTSSAEETSRGDSTPSEARSQLDALLEGLTTAPEPDETDEDAETASTTIPEPEESSRSPIASAYSENMAVSISTRRLRRTRFSRTRPRITRLTAPVDGGVTPDEAPEESRLASEVGAQPRRRLASSRCRRRCC